nr:hypothetical protein [Tanacetum cinerariifolium]
AAVGRGLPRQQPTRQVFVLSCRGSSPLGGCLFEAAEAAGACLLVLPTAARKGGVCLVQLPTAVYNKGVFVSWFGCRAA